MESSKKPIEVHKDGITWDDVVAMYEKLSLEPQPPAPTYVLINGEWVRFYEN